MGIVGAAIGITLGQVAYIGLNLSYAKRDFGISLSGCIAFSIADIKFLLDGIRIRKIPLPKL
jgi:hypothetical protein